MFTALVISTQTPKSYQKHYIKTYIKTLTSKHLYEPCMHTITHK